MNRMPAVVGLNVVEGAEAEGARRATGVSGASATKRASPPDPAVPGGRLRPRPLSGEDAFHHRTKFGAEHQGGHAL